MRTRVHRSAAAAHVFSTARRRAFVPLLGAVLLAAACGGDGGESDDAGSATPAPPPAAEAAPEAAPQPGPVSVSPEDSIRSAREDSAQLARDYHQRMGARESLASCLAKAKQADPPQRAVLETACQRSLGTAP